MDDDQLRIRARAVGLTEVWSDNQGRTRWVRPEILRAALESVEACIPNRAARAMIVTTRARSASLPGAQHNQWARLELESGGVVDVRLNGDSLPAGVAPEGYHHLYWGERSAILAVTPDRAYTIADAAGGRKIWGASAQIYGLRRNGDLGNGDFGSVAILAEQAARRGADCLMLSPAHALFTADTRHYSPYSPSSRIFYNSLYAACEDIFAPAELNEILGADWSDESPPETRDARAGELLDWPHAARNRAGVYQRLFRAFHDRELTAAHQNFRARDFKRFVEAGGEALRLHAAFEALHAERFGRDFTQWHWRDWPQSYRCARSFQVSSFCQANKFVIDYHMFRQWLTQASLARAQGRARAAGMAVGLIGDLAIGANPGGAHVWADPDVFLKGLSIGAPPDALAPHGQNWGLAAFSPHALSGAGYQPFLQTLRATLRHCGGIRIDHVMGLMRLWMIPDGASGAEGVYLSYPVDELMGLVRLESQRHQAIVIGEDLGTLPLGLRDQLQASGFLGMRILQFERDATRFYPPDYYPCDSVAMTSTHDTATLAGYISGCDIFTRDKLNKLPPGQALEDALSDRNKELTMLRKLISGKNATEALEKQDIDAGCALLAQTPSDLVCLPLEDILGLEDQPNLPDTVDEHPNWRRCYPKPVERLLETPGVEDRLKRVNEIRRGRTQFSALAAE